jgi:hypothetical protein
MLRQLLQNTQKRKKAYSTMERERQKQQQDMFSCCLDIIVTILFFAVAPKPATTIPGVSEWRREDERRRGRFLHWRAHCCYIRSCPGLLTISNLKERLHSQWENFPFVTEVAISSPKLLLQGLISPNARLQGARHFYIKRERDKCAKKVFPNGELVAAKSERIVPPAEPFKPTYTNQAQQQQNCCRVDQTKVVHHFHSQSWLVSV